jgi:aryl-alcohol dehydrogenase-like predicted oxidoreductase
MQYRTLGRTGLKVSAISFGAWAIGGTWGDVDDATSLAALNRAVDLGVNFIDTADVYGDGRSERLIAKLKKERPRDAIVVATKAGRRLAKQMPEGYSLANLTAWIDRSRKNLEMETLDLLQLHCPPSKVYEMPEVFGYLDQLVKAGKIRFYGISVETVEEALRGIEHPNVQTVQMIFNMMRLKPADRFFAAAKARKVGILARVPLASGLSYWLSPLCCIRWPRNQRRLQTVRFSVAKGLAVRQMRMRRSALMRSAAASRRRDISKVGLLVILISIAHRRSPKSSSRSISCWS